MIACISPLDIFLEENVSTLNYATKAAYISNEPTRNDDPKSKFINNLKSQVGYLKTEIDKASDRIKYLHAKLNQKIETEGKESLVNSNVSAEHKKSSVLPLNEYHK